MLKRDEIESEAGRLRAMLRALIRAAGLSNREVERRMGFSTHSGYLSRLFHGSRELKVHQVLAILAAVELPPANFFQAAYPDPVMHGEPARLQRALEAMFPAAAGPEVEC